jgi:hypothetical protein
MRATAKEVFIPVCEDRDRRERREGSDKATKNLPAGIPMASGPGKERLSLAQMAAKARKQ